MNMASSWPPTSIAWARSAGVPEWMYSRMIQGAATMVTAASRPRPAMAMVMVARATCQAWRWPRVLRTSTNTGTKMEDRIPPRTSS